MSEKHKALQLGNLHKCPQSNGDVPHVGGEIVEGHPSVLIEGKPAVTEGDACVCIGGGAPKVTDGDPNVFINGKRLATTKSKTSHNGTFITSSSSVYVGNKGNAKVHMDTRAGGQIMIGPNVFINCGTAEEESDPFQVPCFPARKSNGYKRARTPEDKQAYLDEYGRQLDHQETHLNQMSAKQWLKNRANYFDPELRKADRKVRASKRLKVYADSYKKHMKDLRNKPEYSRAYVETLHRRSMYPDLSDEEYRQLIKSEGKKIRHDAATRLAKAELANKDVLHNPDGSIGGIYDDLHDTMRHMTLGDRSVNRSIGKLLERGRIGKLEGWVKKLPLDDLLNISLTICPE